MIVKVSVACRVVSRSPFERRDLGRALRYDVSVLLVTRGPESWLRSVYKNMVLMGVSKKPESFLGNHSDIFVEWLNLDRLVALYEQHFGERNVTVLPYELLRDNQERFAQIVNELIGAPVMNAHPPRNKSLNDSATERVRKAWEVFDGLFPQEPSWEDPGTQYKLSTWRFRLCYVQCGS